MKYYVVADPHGFYTEMVEAMTKAGYFDDKEPRKLVVCGDLFDRGQEAVKMQEFILDLMAKDEVILVRGNHEDLFISMMDADGGIPYNHHISNGTYSTALQLTGYDKKAAYAERAEFVKKVHQTPYYTQIIPAMVDYFEDGDYIFVHGWIPTHGGYPTKLPTTYMEGWRNATAEQWLSARWDNGMEVSRKAKEPGKTILCGHWHCSYGHSYFEFKGSEFEEDADFTPYYGEGIIALDACTVHSHMVNCIIVET